MTKAELEESLARVIRERDEAMAARTAIAAELAAARETVAACRAIQAEHAAALAEVEQMRTDLEALRAELPRPAELSPSLAVTAALTQLFAWYGVEDPEATAQQALTLLAQSDALPETAARALAVFGAR